MSITMKVRVNGKLVSIDNTASAGRLTASRTIEK